MIIKIEIKKVYGEFKAYPACDKSRIFASMLGTKTLTLSALDHIQRLGYSIEYKNEMPVFLKSA